MGMLFLGSFATMPVTQPLESMDHSSSSKITGAVVGLLGLLFFEFFRVIWSAVEVLLGNLIFEQDNKNGRDDDDDDDDGLKDEDKKTTELTNRIRTHNECFSCFVCSIIMNENDE